MLFITAVSLLAALTSMTVYFYTKNPIAYSLLITFGTIFYHFAMRLIVGYTVNAIFHNRMDNKKTWFRERKFERKLYKTLNVKAWKVHVPAYEPENFDLSKRSAEEVVQAMCQAEVVHEIIMLLSLVPIVFTVWFGSLAVFLITSLAAFAVDGVFVIMQRYNRPRLARLIRKQRGIINGS